MKKFFIVLSVLVVMFTLWCGYTKQPRETHCINLVSMTLSFELIRLYGKNRRR